MSSSEAEFDDSDDEPIIRRKRSKTATSTNTAKPKSSKPRKKIKLEESDDENGNNGDNGDSDEDFQVKPKPKKKRAIVSTDLDDLEPKPTKRVKKESSSAKTKKVKSEATKAAAKSPKKTPKKSPTKKPPRSLKKLEKAERISHGMQSFLWWDAPNPPKGCQWSSMDHAGVCFAEPYVPHGVKFKYNGKEVDLNAEEEEAATFFAAMDPEGMHLGDKAKAPIFIKNFFADFKKILSPKHKITDFKKCDFTAIRNHLEEQKLVKKAITDAQKKNNKAGREQTMFKYGYALVDGHVEKVGNYNMEPPGTFRGRGEHPKMGKLKSRVFPEQVSINVSECARVPPCDVPGHAWGDVTHNPQVQWLSQWKENINGQAKYVQLAAQSSFKGKSDRSKYNKAALLCGNIDQIRKSYKKKLKSKDMSERQLATAMWVIDRLALRVGGEKDTDEEADTVGCCSLRVEHLTFDPDEHGGDCKEIELNFLGKDSMRFQQTIDFGATMYTEENGMGVQVFENFKIFCKKKKQSDEVFDSLTPTILNQHLKTIMEGLTAKVFRTYNASKTLQDELRNTEETFGKSWMKLNATEKVVEYDNANRKVAILCNHQRSVSKAQNDQLDKLGKKIDQLKKQKKILKSMLKRVSDGKTEKLPMKKDEKVMVEKANKALEKAKKMKEEAKTDEKKIKATEADTKAKEMKREAAELKFSQAHLWDKAPSVDQVVKKIKAWTGKIEKAEFVLRNKDDNKEVALTTSKINYMDPRISVAWCKRNEVPIEKIFSKTLRDKFNWAMAVPADWEFNESITKQG